MTVNRVSALIRVYVFTSISIAQQKFGSSSPTGTTYLLRIMQVIMCPASHREMFLSNISINQYGMQQYISSVVNVPNDMNVKKMHVLIERCNYDGFDCENFQTWKLNDICVVAAMKDQIWSPVVDSTTPKFTCPHVRKGVYNMINATINVNKALQLYPEASKYAWRGNASIINAKGNVISCTHAVGKVLAYRERKRKT